jgi:hypothetical protein
LATPEELDIVWGVIVLEHWVSVREMMLTLIVRSPGLYKVPEILNEVNTRVKQKKDALEESLTAGRMDIDVYRGELSKALARQKAKVDRFAGNDREYPINLMKMIQSDLDAFDE